MRSLGISMHLMGERLLDGLGGAPVAINAHLLKQAELLEEGGAAHDMAS